MARKSTPAHQSSFLKRDIPRMPEGYYSSGPNPHLRRFVEEHATPYDPENDDYNVPPFDQPITTTKTTATYNIHTYWSRKPHYLDAARALTQAASGQARQVCWRLSVERLVRLATVS